MTPTINNKIDPNHDEEIENWIEEQEIKADKMREYEENEHWYNSISYQNALEERQAIDNARI
jgi:uncharacterized protein (DUF1330 family)|tara:strand:- start:12 stop:197 length:186 start_codon:yes stop_codon:yes gene_type:complete